MMHYVIERDADGMPARLVWSSEMQKRVEQQIQEQDARRRAEIERQRRPAPWIEDWLQNRAPKP